MNKEAPLVSVITPTYKRPEKLREAIETALNQTYTNFEIIVVDDGSPDSLEPVVCDFDDPRIRFHRLESNRGANVARNEGIKKSKGEYIAFLDDDDRWKNSKIEKQVDVLENQETVGVCYTGQLFVNSDGRVNVVKRPDKSGDVTRYLLKGGDIAPFSCLMVRRSEINRAGYPDPDLPSLQDREWLLRLSRYTHFSPIEQPLVLRRQGEYDQIGDNHERHIQSYERIYNKHSKTATKEGMRFKFYLKSTLLRNIGMTALHNREYSEARKYLIRSFILYPSSLRVFAGLLISVTGGRFHETIVSLYRSFHRETKAD